MFPNPASREAVGSSFLWHIIAQQFKYGRKLCRDTVTILIAICGRQINLHLELRKTALFEACDPHVNRIPPAQQQA
ncbi:unnamed protein product [Larinioides sclopetarius]|uniref:Uncharacterized protein n=1 Tax=Larinioides sclopetarius TaxID=280406 RepID=A0AAV2BVK9_9ARAC